MPDMEKVVKGLRDIDMFIAERLGYEKAKNFLRSIDEAIALLKEQEAVEIEWKCGFPHCSVCGQMLPEGDAVKFCLHCGRAVKWE